MCAMLCVNYISIKLIAFEEIVNWGEKSKELNEGFYCCCCSVAQSCPTLWDPMDCSMPGSPVLHHLPEFTQTHVHWVDDALQPSHPLSSPSPPALEFSQCQGLFQWVGSLCQVVKVMLHWSEMLHFSISPFNEHSRLISFRTDWFDLIAVQGTLKWMWKWKSLNHVGLYTPWNSPGQNIGVGSLSLLQGIRDWTQISCIAGRFFTSWATKEAQEYWSG